MRGLTTGRQPVKIDCGMKSGAQTRSILVTKESNFSQNGKKFSRRVAEFAENCYNISG
jgi:hypothetical protein